MRDRWIVLRRPRLVVPPGVPIWPTVVEARPWGLPAWYWNWATPWAWARIYGHIGERAIYQVWWWSRGPTWWLSDQAHALDWRIQGKAKQLHEARVRRSGYKP